MYALILTLFLYGDGGNDGQGGASVTVEKFASKDECYIVRNAFLSMQVTADEISGSRFNNIKVTRNAECVSLDGRAWPAIQQ